MMSLKRTQFLQRETISCDNLIFLLNHIACFAISPLLFETLHPCKPNANSLKSTQMTRTSSKTHDYISVMVAYLVVQDTMENKKYDTLRKRRKEILIFCNADSFRLSSPSWRKQTA